MWHVYLAVDSTVIVGAIATSRGKDEIIVDQIAVDPTRQGAGVGGWLLEQKKKQFEPMTYARFLSTQLK